MGKPKIVLLDIETLPDMRGALENWPSLSNYPGLTFRGTVNSICVFGYKLYHGKTKAKTKSVWEYKGWKKSVNDDKELCEFIYDLLKDAHAIVTQNGKRFDIPFINTRLAVHGLPLLPDIQHVDTKILAKNNFAFFSNSLKHLAEKLTNTEKMPNEGWSLWVDTYDRKPKAMNMMKRYCAQDVEAMEAVFKRLIPYAKTLPNYNLFRNDGAECCHRCGGFNFKSEGTRTTATKIYQRLYCKDCGSLSRGAVVKKLHKDTAKNL